MQPQAAASARNQQIDLVPDGFTRALHQQRRQGGRQSAKRGRGRPRPSRIAAAAGGRTYIFIAEGLAERTATDPGEQAALASRVLTWFPAPVSLAFRWLQIPPNRPSWYTAMRKGDGVA